MASRLLWASVALLSVALTQGLALGQAAPQAEGVDRRPSLFLLSIGVSDYRAHGAGHDLNLRYADDDALAMVRWAQGQEGRYYRAVSTLLLVDEAAERKHILQALDTFFLPSRPGDVAIVFIAAHGTVEGRSFHLWPHDVEPGNVVGTGLRQSDLELVFLSLRERGRASQVLFLIDACHAGQLAGLPGEEGARGARSPWTPSFEAAPSPRGSEEMFALFSAGSAGERALEGEDYRLPWEEGSEEIAGHGIFTWALLRALGSGAAEVGAADGRITLMELERFVSEEVAATTLGEQRPVMSRVGRDQTLAWVPGTLERCDGVDNDLDRRVDEGFPDLNGNGAPDCREGDVCDGLDNDGDGLVDEGTDLDGDGRVAKHESYDRDGDGYLSTEACGPTLGQDCDDRTYAVHPGQVDWGNLQDDDCDGLWDEDDTDTDGDGIPDRLGRAYDRARRGSMASSGAALVSVGAALAASFRMRDLRAPCEGGACAYLGDPTAIGVPERYVALSWTALVGALTAPALAALAVATRRRATSVRKHLPAAPPPPSGPAPLESTAAPKRLIPAEEVP